MKKFRITIDGKTYNVEVEEVKEGQTQPAVKPSRPAQVAPSTKIEAAPRPAGGSGSVTAPMPGTILKLLVAEGEQVETGQALLILEAMKMENKITATATGKITSIGVSVGQSVETGQQLLTIQ